jgi:hypothetical protein
MSEFLLERDTREYMPKMPPYQHPASQDTRRDIKPNITANGGFTLIFMELLRRVGEQKWWCYVLCTI